MKHKYREVHLSKANMERLLMINRIITEYQNAGYVLTLRQLYYQLVTRDVIPNVQSEYSKLSTLLKEGRMGGIVDWDAIEDRLRVPSKPSAWENPKSIMRSVVDQYMLPRQNGQDNYVEVWVEKDALSGVLKRVTEQYHVSIMVNRGYSSVSAMHDAYKRFESAMTSGQNILILYLGDFDPSGQDMIRDVQERVLEFFGEKFEDYDQEFTVKPIALTKRQIDQYNPPPNPAKVTDPRADKYIAEHGAVSWEVDALKPEVLDELLHREIQNNIDLDIFEEVKSREKADIDKLKKLMNQL